MLERRRRSSSSGWGVVVALLHSRVGWVSYPDGVEQVGVGEKFLEKWNWFLLQTIRSRCSKSDKRRFDEFHHCRMSVTW